MNRRTAAVLGVFALLVLLISCQRLPDVPDTNPPPRPEPTQLPPLPDAGPSDAGDEPLPNACERAGARLKTLHCQDNGRDLWQSPEGKPFGAECLYAASKGRDWHPECLERIPDCTWLKCAFRGDCC